MSGAISEYALQAERVAVVLRWLGIAIVLAIAHVLDPWSLRTAMVDALLATAAIYNVAVQLWLARRGWRPALPIVTATIDIVLMTVGCGLTGGVESDLRYFLFFFPFSVALRLDFAAAMTAALMACASFLALAAFDGLTPAELRAVAVFSFFQIFLAYSAGSFAALVVRSHADLEAQVAARTHELVAANAHKDEFLSVISHELRTPLNFIMGFASILEDEVAGPLNERQREAARNILDGGERMLALVHDLLDFTKLQAGRLDLDRRPTFYGRLVGDVLAEAAPRAAQKGVVLESRCEERVTLDIDGPRVAQALAHLIDNALKFTPGGGRVEVRVFRHEDQVLTEVADTGPGISASDLPRLFRRFEQLDMSRTRPAGGVGIGLAMAKGLIEAHGGTIGVKSDHGAGSTFWFALPARGGPRTRDGGARLG